MEICNIEKPSHFRYAPTAKWYTVRMNSSSTNAGFSDQQLQAYLDEMLPTAGMSAVEQQLREDGELRERILELAGRREAGVHGLGEIWRRHRLSCPPRTQLGGYLLAALAPEQQSYVEFHLQQVGCRLCAANLQDLQQQHDEQQQVTAARRRRFFQTSAGLLRERTSG